MKKANANSLFEGINSKSLNSNAEEMEVEILSQLNVPRLIIDELVIGRNMNSKIDWQQTNNERTGDDYQLPEHLELVCQRQEEWEERYPNWETIIDYHLTDIFEPACPDILQKLNIHTEEGTLHTDYCLPEDLAKVEPVFENVYPEVVTIDFTRWGFLYIFLKASNMGLLNAKDEARVWK